jgi:hypothetical protein
MDELVKQFIGDNVQRIKVGRTCLKSLSNALGFGSLANLKMKAGTSQIWYLDVRKFGKVNYY